MSYRTYRLERQSIIRVTKQHKDEPRPLKFAHLFKNAITMNEILKFLEKTEITTRNWLQNQGRMEEKKGVKKGEEYYYYYSYYSSISACSPRAGTDNIHICAPL
jgi:hypothetical protein